MTSNRTYPSGKSSRSSTCSALVRAPVSTFALSALIPQSMKSTGSDQPIGVFDSGIGGLTVVRRLVQELPDESILYFGDTARVPYGSKSAETVLRYAQEASAFLVARGAKLVVIACNTATAHAESVLRSSLSVPVLGVIEPGARAAVAATRSGRIGGAVLDKRWCDDVDCPNYQNAQGQFLLGSIDNNRVEPYFNFSLNGSYNMQVGDLRQFQVFGSINNLFDKSPPFTGGGISGATANYHDILGRAYRMGVRMKF